MTLVPSRRQGSGTLTYLTTRPFVTFDGLRQLLQDLAKEPRHLQIDACGTSMNREPHLHRFCRSYAGSARNNECLLRPRYRNVEQPPLFIEELGLSAGVGASRSARDRLVARAKKVDVFRGHTLRSP